MTDLGIVTAYAYYTEGGGTKTEAEFTELMASYGTVAESAAASAILADEKANAASASATQASESASSASASATQASQSETNATAAEASVRANAQAATDAATEAQRIAESIESNITIAQNAATNASTSASNASASATQAESSASNASASAQSASESATNAAESEGNARTSETNATRSAEEASASATTASTKASEASASATSASESASTASTKAQEASQSANNASVSANTASTKATEATTAATNAETYKNQASTSADNASASATRAEEAAASITVDATLTQSGKAADAKVTGDEISELKNDLITSQTEISITWEDGGIDTTTGELITGRTNAKRTASFIPTSNADDITKTGSPGITIFYYNYDENSDTYVYATRVWIPAGTAYSVNKNYTHFKLMIIAASITGLSVRGYIGLYNYAHALEPRIQSNEESIVEINGDIDFINAKLDGMIPSETYTGTIISEEFSGSPFDAIEIDTTDSTADLYVCGKNIYPKYPSGSANGLSWTVADDGTITFSGTPTADTLLRLRDLFYPVTGTECAFAFFNNKADSRLTFFLVNAQNTNNYQLNLNEQNKTGNFTPSWDGVELRIRIPKDIDWTGLILRPMFVIGSATGEFEAYKGGKTAVTLTDGKVNETITTFSGINTVWSNKGNITVTATSGDLIDYINNNLDVIRYSGGFYKFTQSNNASYLNVYFQSGENFIGYELHNVPAPLSNSNTWQLGHTVAYKFDGTNLSDAVELIEGGEYELAMRENGAADYCGGNNHGDENTVTFKLFIDGEQVTDLAAFATGEYKTFNRIDAFDISLVDRCDTPGDNIAQHQKHWTFEGGKVEVQQTLKFLQDLRLDVVLLCMCCATRSQFPYGIRQGAVDIEDMSTSGFPHITTLGNDASYFYFGDNATINIKAKTDSPTQSALYINSTATQNKLYYGYYQATNSANPTEVTAGTIIQETSLYDVAYN